MTKQQDIAEILKNSNITIWPGRYAMIKAEDYPGDLEYFFISKDDDETTIVLKEEKLRGVEYKDIQQWFKLIEIAVSMPFFAVGFLASVTTAIAQKGLNVLVISTFSKDYLLIREENNDTAVEALLQLGMKKKTE